MIEFISSLQPIFATIAYFAIVVVGIVYLLSTTKREKDRISDQQVQEAIDRQETVIKSLKLESAEITRQYQQIKLENEQHKLRIESLQSEVERWKDAATNKTAISEVRAIIQSFQDQIPAQQQLISEFQKNDREIMAGMKEIREMIRKLPQETV